MNKKAYFRGIGAGLIVAAIVMGVSSGGRMSDAEILRRAKEIEQSQSTVLTEINKDTESSNTSVDNIENKETEPQKEVIASNDADTTQDNNKEDINKEVEAESDKETTDKETSDKETTDKESINKEETDKDASKEEVTKGENADKKTDEKESSDETSSDKNTSVNVTSGDGDDKSVTDISKPEPNTTGNAPETDKNTEIVKKEGSVQIQIVRGDSSVKVSRRLYEAGLVESAPEFDKFLCENGYDKSISVGTYDIAYGLDFEQMAKIIARRK